MASVLVSENPVPTPPVLEKMIEIFAILGEKCLGKPLTETNYTRFDSANYAHIGLYIEEEDIDPTTAGYLKTKLAKEDIFPCATRWVSLSDKPIVPDDKRLKKVFDGENGVHFIALEQQKSRRHVPKSRVAEKKMEFVQVFLRACGIPKLSKCVEEKLTTGSAVVYDQCHDVQQYFHQIVPCVQRYIYHQLPDLYSKLVEDEFPKMLAKMTFAMVGKLEIVYYLKHLPQVTVAQEAKWGHENLEDRIYFYAVNNQVEIAQPLNQEIAKLFGAGGVGFDKKFENFLELLQVNLEKHLEAFLLGQDVDSLPEEEEEWYFPEPEIPKTPEIVEEEIPPDFPTEKASSREYEDDGTLHSWPPRAPVTGMTTRSHPSETRPQDKALEMWPVPEAPNSAKNQITTDEVLPSSSRAVVSHGVGTEENRPEGNVRNNSQQSRTLKHQQKVVEPNGSVQKETTNPQIDVLAEDKASEEQLEQVSQQNNTVPVESFSVFTPGMQVSVQDLEFENVPTVSLPDVPVLHQNPNKDAIGRWGEQFVYEYLQSLLNPIGDISIIIDWKNKLQNSVAPYDIEIRKKSNDAEETTFIEVKSTTGDDKEHFEISAAELKFALEQKDRLHLYRVFNAGSSENVRIQRAMNLAAHLEHKSVKLFMVL